MPTKLLYILLFLFSTMTFDLGATPSLSQNADSLAADTLLCEEEGTPPDGEEEEEPDCE